MATEEPESDDLPAYAFVPGGLWPHPSRCAEGREAGPVETPPGPIRGDAWRESAAYVRGFRLFNGGYYWEAHEAWEALWHAHGRRGATADLIKGLIKLAAAGVKVREGQPHGVVTHARRAMALFDSAREAAGRFQVGLDLEGCAGFAREIAAQPPNDPGPAGARVVRVFARDLWPR
jgi:hypothetical protein